MKIEDIMEMWNKDSKIDETELATESSNIPVIHNKYLKIFMAERVKLFSAKADLKKKRRLLLEYYLGELDEEELKELGRDQFYKKLLKNEVDLYIDSDDALTEQSLRVSLQEEKVNYLEAVLRQINNRGFQIKNAIDWNRFITG
tara:strand:+ start:174 stop:605 length:432 start_codon:yes stop_codon:yes gene_type:complete